MEDFYLVFRSLTLGLTTKGLVTGYQSYVRKQKHSAVYLVHSETWLLSPVPRKKPVTRGVPTRMSGAV